MTWEFYALWGLILWCLGFFLLAFFRKGNRKLWIILEVVGLIALFAVTFWIRKRMWG